MIPILSLAPNSWFGPWMNRQQLLSRFPDNFNILYSQGVFPSWELGGNRWNSASLLPGYRHENGIKVQTRGKLPLKFRSGTVLDRVMVSCTVHQWKKQLKWEEGEGVGYFFSPAFKDYAQPLNPRCLVYHVYDQFQNFPGWTKEQEYNHRWMLDQANIVIASSQMIARSLEGISGREVTLVENGVDFSAFSSANENPQEFQQVSGPKIVYTGNINRKVDLGLVYRLSKLRPDWNWFFIGRVNNLDDVASGFYKSLLQLDNVHFLGHKPIDELPKYVTNSSVNIMNYRLGDGLWSDSGYPLKLNEYLASGKPIVSSDMESVRQYNNVVEIAKTDMEWMSMLDLAVKEKDQDIAFKRRSIAKGNSWNSKVNAICTLIAENY